MAGRKKSSALILNARKESTKAYAHYMGEEPRTDSEDAGEENTHKTYQGTYEGRYSHQGRPIDYTPEMGDFICEFIETGGLLMQLCSEPGMPHRSTVFRWTRDVEDFGRRYAQARANSASVFEEAALHLLMGAKNMRTDARLLDVQVKHLLHVGAKRNPGLLGAAADKVAETQEPIIVEGGLPEMPIDEPEEVEDTETTPGA